MTDEARLKAAVVAVFAGPSGKIVLDWLDARFGGRRRCSAGPNTSPSEYAVWEGQRSVLAAIYNMLEREN